jgi:hypothetical protein
VVIQKQQYQTKVTKFTYNNHTLLNEDSTPKLHGKIISNITQRKDTTSKEYKHTHHNLNPTTPMIQALIKAHKVPISIQPIINWKNAPAYPLATQLSALLKQHKFIQIHFLSVILYNLRLNSNIYTTTTQECAPQHY